MIPETLLVGQNLFNKDSGSPAVFEPYFDVLLALADNRGIPGEERLTYLDQAASALAFFSENAVLDETVVQFIGRKRGRLEAVSRAIQNERIQRSEEALRLIEKLIEQISRANSRQEYEKSIGQIGEIDAAIDRDLTVQQQERYAMLTKRCTEIVERKAQEFRRRENIQYNLEALEAYEKIFRLFQGSTGLENHMEIVKGLFAFDASRLTNETLVYYNHVYSYILSKLDDSGKFALTKYAVMCEKRR